MSHSAATTNARRPSHLALCELLRARIDNGQHAIGSLLPPEERLQTDLGHSRYAVRQALRQLEEEGMISRRRGVGTTVMSRTPVHTYRHAVGSREDLLSYAHTTRIVWSKSSFVQTDGALARQLGCDEARQWQKLHGIRYEEDGAVLCLVDLYIDVTRAKIGDERIFDGGPVYEWLEKHFGLTPHGLSQDIQAKSLTPNEARLLNDQPGASSLQIIRRYFDPGNQNYLISVNAYRSRDFVYNLRLHLR